jgi:octaprenyl-diphosphate synthase
METDLLEKLSPEIEKINRNLALVLAPEEDLLSEIGFYNFKGGGKRLRPLLFLLSARALGAPRDDEKLYGHALVFELIHMASLIHDDIVDNSELRRGRKAAHVVYGPGEAVLAGDYLLAKASSLAIETDNFDFLRVLTDVISELSLGELYQLKAAFKSSLSETDYTEIIRRKTAFLLTAAVKAGAIMSGANSDELALMESYGLNFGLSFQVTDDVLDYEADPDKLGKPILKDLGEGRITLPFILALKELPKDKAQSLIRLVENRQKDLSPEEKEEIRKLVKEGRGPENSIKVAKNYAALAKDALKELPPSDAKEILLELAEYSSDREK